MRVLTVAAPAALFLALAACAPTLGPSQYADELRRLSDGCESRGGILVPTGQQSGRPQNDHVCQIAGGPSRLTSGG